MTIRAKFVCDSVIPTQGEQTIMTAHAVYGGSEENKSFSRWTPAGSFTLMVSNESQAAEFFRQGKEFYLDMSEVTTE